LINIAVINQSTAVSDTEVAAAVPNLNIQVQRDVAPIWGINAQVTYVPKGQIAPANSWQVIILDNSDQAGALGYHDLTANGYPISKVFAATDKKYNLSWTVTASHEICEMLVDPDCVLAAQTGNTTFVAFEVCDPCEADKLGYSINGTLVSDFVTPAWFQPKAHKPYDFCNHITAPLTLLPGGYVSIWTPTKGWTQKTAETTGHTSRAAMSQRCATRGQELKLSDTQKEAQISINELEI
jgi:hypothetical protein